MGLNRVGGKFFTRVNIFEALPEFHQQSSSGFMVIVPAREAFFNHPHKFDVTPTAVPNIRKYWGRALLHKQY